MHISVAIAILTCGVFLSASIQNGTIQDDLTGKLLAPLQPPKLSFTSARGRLQISGTSASTAHETELQQLASDYFGHYETRIELRPGVVTEDNWASRSARLLYVLAAMEFAEASMNQRSINIRGVTSDARTFAARLDFLGETLTHGFAVETDVVVVKLPATLSELCQKAFSTIVPEPISFTKSSIEIRQASFGTLDRITDFAHDCQSVSIVITGHTDTTGDESWNKRLSIARAQAVADHIARNGIAKNRILVGGLGSTEPIADNATAQGRALNRRIEFELR